MKPLNRREWMKYQKELLRAKETGRFGNVLHIMEKYGRATRCRRKITDWSKMRIGRKRKVTVSKQVLSKIREDRI